MEGVSLATEAERERAGIGGGENFLYGFRSKTSTKYCILNRLTVPETCGKLKIANIFTNTQKINLKCYKKHASSFLVKPTVP